MSKNKYQKGAIYFVRQTPVILIIKLLTLELMLVFAYLLIRLPKFFINDISSSLFVDLSYISLLIFVVFTLAEIIAVVLITLQWTNEYYLIRDGDILHLRGVFSYKEETFSLKNVQSFTVDQSFIGRILNYGSIKFYSPVLKQEYFLTNITDPVNLKEAIEDIVNNEGRASGDMIIPIRRV